MTGEYTGAPYPPVNGNEPCIEHPDIFFTDDEGTHYFARAKALCAGCHVREECLAYALTHDEAGVWGGAAEQERRQMRQQGNIRVAPRGQVADRAVIVRAHERGIPNSVIAGLVGVAPDTVHRVLTNHRKRQRERAAS